LSIKNFLLFFSRYVFFKSQLRRRAILTIEKRREKRLGEENEVILWVVSENENLEESFYTFSRDISVGGLRIMTDSPLPVKTRVKLEIALSDSKKLVSGIAEGRWIKGLFDDEVFEMGLEFVEFDPQSKVFLLEHVYKKYFPVEPALKPSLDQTFD
jgi:c-di-GMP-binding flagellar brake protein YcgR